MGFGATQKDLGVFNGAVLAVKKMRYYAVLAIFKSKPLKNILKLS